MKTSHSFALLLVLFVSPFTGFDKPYVIDNSLNDMNLKGNVKSVKETNFDAIDKVGDIEKGNEGFTKYYVFDQNGNKTEESDYGHGVLRKKTLFFYNEQLLLTEVRRVFGLPTAIGFIKDSTFREINEVFNYEYHYNSNGRIIYSIIKSGSYEAKQFILSIDSTVFIYDDIQYTIEKRNYSTKQELKKIGNDLILDYVSGSKYNNLGQLEIKFEGSEVYEDHPDNPKIDLGFKKLKLGKLIRFDTTWVNKFLYKDKLLWTDVVTLEQYGSKVGGQVNIRNDYNKYGDITQITTSTTDLTLSTYEIYDPNRIVTYSYKYDEHNNWVIKTMYSNGIVQSITERTYKYY